MFSPKPDIGPADVGGLSNGLCLYAFVALLKGVSHRSVDPSDDGPPALHFYNSSSFRQKEIKVNPFGYIN